MILSRPTKLLTTIDESGNPVSGSAGARIVLSPVRASALLSVLSGTRAIPRKWDHWAWNALMITLKMTGW